MVSFLNPWYAALTICHIGLGVDGLECVFGGYSEQPHEVRQLFLATTLLLSVLNSSRRYEAICPTLWHVGPYLEDTKSSNGRDFGRYAFQSIVHIGSVVGTRNGLRELCLRSRGHLSRW
jgi:hypothetical protein